MYSGFIRAFSQKTAGNKVDANSEKMNQSILGRQNKQLSTDAKTLLGTEGNCSRAIIFCGFDTVSDPFHIAYSHLVCCSYKNNECSFNALKIDKNSYHAEKSILDLKLLDDTYA